MAEVRVSHLIIVVIILAVIGTPILICLGAFSIGSFDLFGWKTPELSKKTLGESADDALALAAGFKPAKTPAEAMDKFREAIQNRQYKFAARYATKKYSELLERGHAPAAELGEVMDKIRAYGDDKGLMTDKLTFAFTMLDPFPKHFKVGAAPVMKGDDKAYGSFAWDKLQFKNPAVAKDSEWASHDPKMWNIFAPSLIFSGGTPIELVKEKEEWKLNIPVNQLWETNVSNFIENEKRYHTGLDSFKGDMLNNRFDSAAKFEGEILQKLRNAK